MRLLILGLLAAALVTPRAPRAPEAGQGRQTFTGTIADSECSNADHSLMRMGSTDADCTLACVDAHGASFVLYDGKTAYALRGQPPDKFAGKKVTIAGTLDAGGRTLNVESISAAP